MIMIPKFHFYFSLIFKDYDHHFVLTNIIQTKFEYSTIA